MRVDPKSAGGGIAHPGRKIAHACGFHRWTASSGNPMLSIAFVVVSDPSEEHNDEGCTFTERFTITSKAIWRIAAWANATGHLEPFDSDDDDIVSKVCAMSAVVVDLREDTYNGKTRIVPADRGFSRYTGDAVPDLDSIVSSAEAEYQRRMAERQNFGGGGGGGGSAGNSRPPASSSRASADDIPF